jgi:superoxide dismutase, Fe-Mn family
MALKTYKAQDFSKLKGLTGISDQQVEIHLGLYGGYVTNTNKLNEQIADLIKAGKGNTPECAEQTRRLGFEYNGMILHEYYFSNLTPNAKAEPKSGSELLKQIEDNFGGWENWKKAFVDVGSMRGVGWAILYQDPVTDALSNHWVTLHHQGNPAGFKPILVMDVWEHAFMVDYKPSERAKYIEAFFSNVDWDTVDQRIQSEAAIRPAA